MAYDHEAQKKLNAKHVAEPRAGDYWHDMYAPVARVLDVTKHGFIILQKVSGLGGKEITDTDPAPDVMTQKEFKKWLSYDSIPNQYWASVIPERYPPELSR